MPGLEPLRFNKDIPISADMGTLIQLSETISNTRTVSAIIWNSDIMAQPSSASLIEADQNCIAWLNQQAPNSVIYISVGSLATMDQKDLAEMAWGLASSDQPFLWVVRPP